MKINRTLMIFSVFVSVFLIIPSLFVFAELLEPTRTLESQQQPSGRLSVFSEPPELDVRLDGVEIGKTPLVSKEVTAGVHILQVKDTEKEITILSGKSLQLSLFKDSLIEFPEKKAEAPSQPKLREMSATEEKKAEDSNEDKIKYDHFYWPLNPSGPIK